MREWVKPGHSDWPDDAAWADLSGRLGGRLERPVPISELLGSIRPGEGPANPFWIRDQAAGTQTSGWHGAWTPAPSACAVRARDAADVALAVNFARDHNLRLVVKGTGHSYLGHSTAPGSLMIWTRDMDDVVLHDSFVPTGSDATIDPVPAVTTAAGAIWADLYHAVTVEGGRYVQGGGCMTVGVAGLIQGGGFGIFSKNFGMAAASLLEAEIVTADGVARIVNRFHHPDLFWALKGGGGGSFGVVTRLTLQTHALPHSFGLAQGQLRARSDTAFKALLRQVFRFYRSHLMNPHWGDHFHFGTGNNFELGMVSQGLSSDAAGAVWAGFFEWLSAAPDDYEIVQPFETQVMPARAWWDAAQSPLLTVDPRPGAAQHYAWSLCDQDEVGVYLHHYDSLWMPATLLEDDGIDQLVDAVFAASRQAMVRFQCAKGLAGAPEAARLAARDTAINPRVIDAFALAVIADGAAPAYPGTTPADPTAARDNAQAAGQAIAELRAIVPDAGSYIWETSYFLKDWQTAFWGENHARLHAVKQAYDPSGLFVIHHGVGTAID